MKHEWRKQEKELYLPKQTPIIIKVKNQKFIAIKGRGKPSGETFENNIETLYSIAYAIKMLPKKGYKPDGFFEYTVYPLEGLWDLTEKGKNEATLNKEELVYTLMIRQPDFADQTVFAKAVEATAKKKSLPLLSEVYFTEIEDGLCVQILHVGSYDTEPASFEKMKTHMDENHLERTTSYHREIYLSDARKVASDMLKTVLRYSVKQNQ